MLKRLRRYAGGQGLGPTLVRATIGSAGIRIAGMAVTFLVGVQLARGLGAEGYGIYGLAMAIIALLNVPTQFGVPQLLTREVASAQAVGDWPRVHAVLRWANRTVIIAALAVAALVALALALWPERLKDGLASTLAWGLLLVPLVALTNVNGAALRGLQRLVLGQMPEILVKPAGFSLLLLGGYFIAPELSAPLAMALHATAAGASALLAATWLKRRLPSHAPGLPSTGDIRGWLASALPMALSQGMRVFQGHIAILLLGVFASAASVGLFRVAFATATMVAMPISLLNIVIAPLVAKLYAENDQRRLQRMPPVVALVMLAGCLLLLAPFLLIGPRLLGFVFGAQFEPAHPALLVLCFGHALTAFLGPNGPLLNMTGHERRVTRAFAVSLAVNGVAAVAAIPVWGDLGAAFASVVALFTWNVLMWIDARRLLSIDSSIFGVTRAFRN